MIYGSAYIMTKAAWLYIMWMLFFFLLFSFLCPVAEDYVRYAHGLISEYITEELSKELSKYLG